jgi:CheY-like chemotaxis protein
VSGYDVARQIRQQPRYDGTVLIAQTGWGRDDDRERLDGVASYYVCEKFQACYFLRVSARPFLSIQSLAKR